MDRVIAWNLLSDFVMQHPLSRLPLRFRIGGGGCTFAVLPHFYTYEVNPFSFRVEFGSFPPNFGVRRFGLNWWVVSAVGRFGQLRYLCKVTLFVYSNCLNQYSPHYRLMRK